MRSHTIMTSIDRLAAQDAAKSYVQNTDVGRTGAAPQAPAVKTNQNQQPTRSADSITLSDDARALAAARDAVKNAPDVREQKVDALKQQVSDGTYNVPASV